MKDVLNRLAKHLTPQESKPTSVLINPTLSVPLALEHFHPVPKSIGASVTFIDSGNAELASGPDFSLQFIRVCAVTSGEKTTRTIEEAFCLVRAVRENEKVVYRTELIGIEGFSLPTIDLYEPSLAEGTHRVAPGKVAELARVLAEHRLAAWLLPTLPSGSFLVRDGHLEAHTIHEQTALREIYERARMKGVTVAGVSKTSTLLTDTGHAAVPVISGMGPPGIWYYHVPTTASADHQANVAVTKLHELSRYAFRVDIHDEHLPFLAPLIGALAANSADAAFLGYPYGLVEADRYARVSEDERQALRLRAQTVLGAVLDRNEKAVDAHDTLNKAV